MLLITAGDCAVSVVSLLELAAKEEHRRVRLPTTLDEEIDKQGFRIIPLKPNILTRTGKPMR